MQLIERLECRYGDRVKPYPTPTDRCHHDGVAFWTVLHSLVEFLHELMGCSQVLAKSGVETLSRVQPLRLSSFRALEPRLEHDALSLVNDKSDLPSGLTTRLPKAREFTNAYRPEHLDRQRTPAPPAQHHGIQPIRAQVAVKVIQPNEHRVAELLHDRGR